MNKKVHIQNIGNVTLTDKNYIGAGGEATVYRHGKYAIKIYHDLNTVLPKKKIIELSKIQSPHVLKPLYPVYDSHNTIIGYAMEFVKNTEPICKLFTKSFRRQHNIDHSMIYHLVKSIQGTTAQIHFDDCLIVDFNEMNLLVSNDFKIPYFIDVDSYQTPSYPATALMESIRDHSVPRGHFSNLTDWYAFGILAFQLYIGIHPYKGKHPNYKAAEWQKRMEDGISVFDSKVKLPQVCNDFSIIPDRHKIWMQDMFIHNNRSEPPQIDASAPIFIAAKKIIISSNNLFDIETICELANYSTIMGAYNFFGQKYYVTQNVIYKDKYAIDKSLDKLDKVLLCETTAMTPVTCKLTKESLLNCYDKNDSLVLSLGAKDAIYKNGNIFAQTGNTLSKISFRSMNDKVYGSTQTVAPISENSTMYDGVIYQNLLGKPHLTVPRENSCETFNIKELEKFRILDMKLERNMCVVMGEQKGIYYRFTIIFDYAKRTYDIRTVKDVSFDAINFTVLKKGVCILAVENQLEVFVDNHKIKVIEDSPIDSSMRLFSFDNDVYFTHENKVMSITMK